MVVVFMVSVYILEKKSIVLLQVNTGMFSILVVFQSSVMIFI